MTRVAALALCACALSVTAGCGNDDYDDDLKDIQKHARGEPPSVAEVEASLEERLEEPGLNALVVESVKCRPNGDEKLSCDIVSTSADSVGDRNGALELERSSSEGDVYRVSGKLGEEGLTNEFQIGLKVAPVKKPYDQKGYPGEVDAALTELLGGPGPASVKVTRVRCDAPSEPKPGASFACDVTAVDRDDRVRVKGVLKLRAGAENARGYKIDGTLAAVGKTIFPARKLSVPE